MPVSSSGVFCGSDRSVLLAAVFIVRSDCRLGAGKSTLIKMLIELTSNTRQGPVPVVGSVNHSVPTSGDVHLYSDPSTYNSDYPILYADCEGLEGGENEPMAVQARRGDNVAFTLGQGRRTGSFQKRLRKKHHSSQREITWATTPERRSRQYSVTNLYPRLLYTFSDAVVFVLKNARFCRLSQFL